MLNVFKRSNIFSKDDVRQLIKDYDLAFDEKLEIIGDNLGSRSKIFWDLAGLDESGEFVLIAIEDNLENHFFEKVFERYDWAWDHLYLLARMYPELDLETEQIPRMIIVSPSFPVQIEKYISYLKCANISFYNCVTIEGETGKGIILEKLDRKLSPESKIKNEKPVASSFEISDLVELTEEEKQEFMK